MATDDDDKRVKDILGEASMADLQRWFGLPSYTQLEEEGKADELPADDPYKEARERRERALAAIEPWFLGAIEARAEKPWTVLTFKPLIDVKVREDVAMFDASVAVARLAADPREVERPEDIEESLNECTPQALLRDLHRVESFFEKQYEVYDAEAHQRFNVVDEVAQVMATDLTLPPLDDLPGTNLKALMADVLEERALPWTELPKRNRMVNRRIVE
ncbi:MAG: hypothetical protein JNL83_22125 [Myxococcales bacterium]|nr:hypothetical protein [Myxococcales bacterium]